MKAPAWLSKLIRRAVSYTGISPRDPVLANWFGTGSSTTSGVSVDQSSALAYSAVYRGVRLIAGTVSAMPINVYRVSGDSKERDKSSPIETLMNRAPNEDMDAGAFREALTAAAILWGNGYAEITFDGETPVGLWPIDPGSVEPSRDDAGALIYEVRSSGATIKLPSWKVLHVRGPTSDGITGESMVDFARESIGLGIATEKFGASFFGNGSMPGGVLEHPGFLEEDAVERLRESWEKIHQGPANSSRLAILEEGMKYNSLSVPPENAQFNETRKTQVVELARFLGTPPHLLFDLDRATFSNIEQQGLEWLNYGLSYWLTRWEREIVAKLVAVGERSDIIVEHDTKALMRADTGSRYAAYKIGREGGWLSVNEIRRAENLPDIGPAGDVFVTPLNMGPSQPQPPDSGQPTQPPGDPGANPSANQTGGAAL